MWVRELSPQRSLAHQSQLGPLHYTVADNDGLLGAVSLVVGVSLLAHASLRGHRWMASGVLRGWARRALVGLLLVAGLAFFYGARGVARPYYVSFWDGLHYALGAKYHDALGYDALYDCAVQADAQMGRPVLGADVVIRDLESYLPVPAATSGGRLDCPARLGTAEWERFKTDLREFRLRGRAMFALMLRDYGVNGSPVHLAVMSRVLAPVELTFRNLTLLSLVDVIAIGLTLVAVSWGFGHGAGMLFGLFFFVNFADRFDHVGGSCARYLWLMFLACGLGLLRRGRHGASAVCMAVSAMLNVFPILFMVGPVLKVFDACRSASSSRRPSLRYGVFGAGTAVCLFAASLALGSDIDDYERFVAKMSIHVEIDNDNRVGFRYVIDPESVPPAAARFEWPAAPQRSSGLSALGLALALVVTAWFVARLERLDDIEAAVVGGLLMLFLWFATVQYYYSCLAFLVLLPRRSFRAPAGPQPSLLVGGMFTLNAGIYLAWAMSGSPGLCNNVLLSWFVGVCLVVSLAYLGRRVVPDLRA